MGKLITVYDDNRLLPDDPNKWPEALKNDIRNCCCGGGSSSGSGTPINPTYPLSCCPSGQSVNLSSVLLMNHLGSITHNRGVTLRRWNGGLAKYVPWIPILAQVGDQNNPGVSVIPTAWYSDFIEHMTSGFRTIVTTAEDTNFTYVTTYVIKDTWHVYYTAFYNFNPNIPNSITACAADFAQTFRREGSAVRVVTNKITGVATSEIIDQRFPMYSGQHGYWRGTPSAGVQTALLSVGSVVGCTAHTSVVECNPYYSKGYLYQVSTSEYSTIFADVPIYTIGTIPGLPPQFFWQDGTRLEPNAWCSGGFLSLPVHSPYLEVIDAAGTPFNFPWVPPT